MYGYVLYMLPWWTSLCAAAVFPWGITVSSQVLQSWLCWCCMSQEHAHSWTEKHDSREKLTLTYCLFPLKRLTFLNFFPPLLTQQYKQKPRSPTSILETSVFKCSASEQPLTHMSFSSITTKSSWQVSSFLSMRSPRLSRKPEPLFLGLKVKKNPHTRRPDCFA